MYLRDAIEFAFIYRLRCTTDISDTEVDWTTAKPVRRYVPVTTLKIKMVWTLQGWDVTSTTLRLPSNEVGYPHYGLVLYCFAEHDARIDLFFENL